MIITAVFYGVKCNRCGDIYDNGDYSFYTDEGSVEEHAGYSDWLVGDYGKHYCPSCSYWDEFEDVRIPKEEFPKHLKELNKFIDSVARRDKHVGDKPDKYVVEFSMFNDRYLKEYQIEYIKSLLCDKFISIEHIKKSHGWSDYIIELKK